MEVLDKPVIVTALRVCTGGTKRPEYHPQTLHRLRRELMGKWRGEDDVDDEEVDDSTDYSISSGPSDNEAVTGKLVDSMKVAKVVSEEEAQKRFISLQKEVKLDDRLDWGGGGGLPSRAKINQLLSGQYPGRSSGFYTHNKKGSLADIDFVLHGGIVPWTGTESEGNEVDLYREYLKRIKVRIHVIGALHKVEVRTLEEDIEDDCPRIHIHGGVLEDPIEQGHGELNDGEYLSLTTIAALSTFKYTKFIVNPQEDESAWIIRNRFIMKEVMAVATRWAAARILHARDEVARRRGREDSMTYLKVCLGELNSKNPDPETIAQTEDKSTVGSESMKHGRQLEEAGVIRADKRVGLFNGTFLSTDSDEESLGSYQTIAAVAVKMNAKKLNK
jgi:hypothetical protein